MNYAYFPIHSQSLTPARSAIKQYISKIIPFQFESLDLISSCSVWWWLYPHKIEFMWIETRNGMNTSHPPLPSSSFCFDLLVEKRIEVIFLICLIWLNRHNVNRNTQRLRLWMDKFCGVCKMNVYQKSRGRLFLCFTFVYLKLHVTLWEQDTTVQRIVYDDALRVRRVEDKNTKYS